MNATALLFPAGGLVMCLWESTRRALTDEERFRFSTGGLVTWQWESTRRVLAGEGRSR